MLFFGGKDTPLKRYKSYFPGLTLLPPSDYHGEVTCILCHSRGFHEALNFCRERKTAPKIVALDGTSVDEIPEGVEVVMFRPKRKSGAEDEKLFTKVIYYEVSEEIEHYPYMKKDVRNLILKELS